MKLFLAEFLGTAILMLLGNGVVANVVLRGTKGHNGGWIVITAGWGFAVYAAVLCVGDISGAHINPAVTIGLAAAGQFKTELVPGYLVAQMLGAITGAILVYVLHLDHYTATKDEPDRMLGTFCTSPAIRNPSLNLLCEIVATFVLVFAVLRMADPSLQINGRETAVGLGSIGAIRVGLIVFAIGLCLGGPTGYAINPARDLGPRIAHFLLPISGKGTSDWSYAAIPVLGPILGAVLAAALFSIIS